MYSGNSVPTFQGDTSVLEDGTDRLSRNVGKELPLYVVQHPRRMQISGIINAVRRVQGHEIYCKVSTGDVEILWA